MVTGAAQPALDFIENERGPMTIGERTAFLQESWPRTFVASAFSEDRLEHDSAGRIVDGGGSSSTRSWNKLTSSSSGSKSLAVLVLPGEGHGSESAAGRAIEGNQTDSGLTTLAMSG